MGWGARQSAPQLAEPTIITSDDSMRIRRFALVFCLLAVVASAAAARAEPQWLTLPPTPSLPKRLRPGERHPHLVRHLRPRQAGAAAAWRAREFELLGQSSPGIGQGVSGRRHGQSRPRAGCGAARRAGNDGRGAPTRRLCRNCDAGYAGKQRRDRPAGTCLDEADRLPRQCRARRDRRRGLLLPRAGLPSDRRGGAR